MNPFSLYIHIPFCRKRCTYCDFNTYAGMERWIPAYVDALCQELAWMGRSSGERISVHTLFLGGGTPSLLTPEQFDRIFAAVRLHFDWQEGGEASLEANPGTVDPEGLRRLVEIGFNRISFGMQSAHPDELRILGRIHDTSDAIRAVQWARQAGFEQVNMDLMFGLPGQTQERWANTLDLALGLSLDHLSLYSLTVEEGTQLAGWVNRGLLSVPDDDQAADLYELAASRLAQAGFERYEISNWAKRDAQGNLLACQHNLQYWRNLPYLGIGAGAHGSAAGYRMANVNIIPEYTQLVKAGKADEFPFSPATQQKWIIDARTEMEESMMVGLRLTQEGVGRRGFQKRFGVKMEDVFGKEIKTLTQQGLLEFDEERARLSPHGVLLGNQVFMAFVSDTPDE